VPVTDDGASYFASWSDDELIISRPDDPTAKDADPVTLRVDPADGTERDAGEVRRVGAQQTAPEASPVYNPAFDVTPAQLIAAIVTERGVFRPPYRF